MSRTGNHAAQDVLTAAPAPATSADNTGWILGV